MSGTNPATYGVGARTAAFLRQAYRRPRAKLIARDFGISPKTAELWLQGTAPTTAHIEKMIAMFGERYLRMAFPEAFQKSDDRLQTLKGLYFQVFWEGGAAGVVVPLDHSRGRRSDGKRAFKKVLAWLARRFHLQPRTAQIKLPSHSERTNLIEGLIETVKNPEGTATEDQDLDKRPYDFSNKANRTRQRRQ